MTIPTFQSETHEAEYVFLFEDKAKTYINLMNKVRDMMYGTGNGDYRNLPGSCLEVVRDITQSLLYDVEYQFEQEHPEYKRDGDDIFIPRKNFKQDVTEALKDALQTGGEQWAMDKDCPPCDTLACETFLGDHE